MNRSRLHFPTLLLILGALVYSNSLGNGFTFDDIAIVVNNPVVRTLELNKIFTSPWWPDQSDLGLFRPVTTLTFALNHSAHGLAPLGYHILNVMLHLLNAAMVFWISLKILDHHPSAVVASLLFLLHPVQTEAVNGLVGRAELLSSFWVLFGWILYIAASVSTPKRQKILYWGSLVAGFIACFCKEHGIVLVGVIALYDCLLRLRERKDGVFRIFPRQDLYRLIPFVLVVGLFVLLRYEIVGSVFLPSLPLMVDNPLAHVSSLERVMTAVSILGKYATMLLFPLSLSADYSYNQIPVVSTPFNWGLLWGGLVLAIVILVVVLSLKGRFASAWGFGPAFMALSGLPASNILFPIGTIMGERLLYLPMVGFCFLLGAIYRLASRHVLPGWVPPLAAGVILLTLGVRTFLRNTEWSSNHTLFQSAVQVSPNSAKAHFNLGNALRDEGDIPGAMAQYQHALSIHNRYVEVHYNKGILYQERGQLKLATGSYSAALLADSLHAPSWINLGTLMGRNGQYQSAYVAFERAKRLVPENLDARFNFGLASQELGRHEEAVETYQDILGEAPDHTDVAINLAELFRETGYSGESVAVYKKLLKARPEAYQVAYNLGVMQEKMGKPEEAAQAYELASRATGDLGVFAIFKMGTMHMSAGEEELARKAFTRFLKKWRGSTKTRIQAEQFLEGLGEK